VARAEVAAPALLIVGEVAQFAATMSSP
jgi:hypothetical protein